VQQGWDPSMCDGDDIFFYNTKDGEVTPLTPALALKIQIGVLRF
jgi:hypothetical protein